MLTCAIIYKNNVSIQMSHLSMSLIKCMFVGKIQGYKHNLNIENVTKSFSSFSSVI
jgi:hypothetical protein